MFTWGYGEAMTDHTHHASERRSAGRPVHLADEVATGIRDEPFDMANLLEEDTGVPGAIYISTRVTQHGPRVKYYQKLGPGQQSFSVSIEDEPAVVANSLPERVVRRMAPRVIEWVRLNRVALLEFWNEGVYWSKARLVEYLDGLERLS